MRLFTAFLLAGTIALAGCNTIEGVGQDVASVGSTVADTANEAK